jgi:hypothetical protein
MEQRGALLRGIAGILNAGGSALLDIYDTATSIKIGLLPGEKGKLKARLREYEKNIERLYYEIGKEAAQRDHADTAGTSPAAEAGIRLVAEYRVKTERIQQCIREIEEKERAATTAATDRAGANAAPEADSGKPAASGATAAGDVSTGRVTEEIKESVAEAETPARNLHEETAESGAPPVAGEPSPGAETTKEAVPEVLEEMLKRELLKICRDRGMDADPRMTKAAIIALIERGRI